MIILCIFFFLIALFSSLVGIGGGIFYVPTLLLWLNLAMGRAASVSLIITLVGTSSALSVFFYKKRLVDWKLAFVLEPCTFFAAFIGGYFSSFIPREILEILLSTLIWIGSYSMWYGKFGNIHGIMRGKWGTWHRKLKGHEYNVYLPIALPVTAFLGLVSGLLGITGGFIKIPVMVVLCGVPMKIAVTTSTVMVFFTASAALLGHGVAHINPKLLFDWKFIIPLVSVVLIGGQIGSRISIHINQKLLRKIFAVFLFLLGTRIWLKVFMG